MLKKNLYAVALFIISLLSTGLFLYKLTYSPPCINADEATNAYDAYSILKTGKDQYGNTLPIRFKSFGDYKMPLLTYMAIPSIAFFGLNEIGIRMVNLPFVLFFPLLVYLLTNEFFGKKKLSLIAAFLIAFSPGLQLLGRQAHEGYMTAFFLTLSFYLFLRFLKKQNINLFLIFLAVFFMTLFGYHSSRLWAGFFFVSFIFLLFRKKIKFIFVVGFFLSLLLFVATDFVHNPTRIHNLIFFKNIGFSLKINEYRAEGGSRLLYNKLTIGTRELMVEYLKYFSPQFFVSGGDENYRFGYPGISPVTPVEYIFLFIGIYYLFKNKEKWRYFILLIFLFSPLSGSLSWAGLSITRVIFIFIPQLIISAYGMDNLLHKKRILAALILAIYIFFLFYSWDLYLNHYPKKAIIARSWQCGYLKLVDYVKENYDNFDHFYITKKNGQPYIFFLFYMQYSPNLYQKEAVLSAPDEYGFGQVESFDKFIFDLPVTTRTKKSAIIGYPDDFTDIEKPYLKTIKHGQETIYYIKEIK